MTAETAPDHHSQTHWFLVGMRGLFSLPAIILMLSFVGFAAFTAEAKIPVGQVMFMTGIVWALPAKVILVGSMLSGAHIATAFLAVTLSSVRMMPMVAALIPEIRTSRTPTWLLLIVSHFVAITAWVFAMEHVRDVPRSGRVAFFAGFGMTLTTVNILLVGLVYGAVSEFPPIVSGCLFFLTPVYFLASIWVSARHRVIYWALGIGLALGWLFAVIAPEYDILLAGIIGGTLAWWVERMLRRKEAAR
ncbi:branched-chain amino acid ABC transporter permease [Shinella sp. WSJ-2]|uniref:AzlC family ABC transporter permease n=1 Tax=Shinella sp. WSJ-2 TaxID=2303749 RepID=UPI000E3C78EB|nr:AzlC family ABC transporter permease [Shinella sp. WSJ-2]RFZ86685.1 branched-chain amino acid ABC transporter permease [Shinella sp. WSJ-2]